MITKQDEEKLGKFFATAFHEVVAPEIVEVKERLTNVEGGIDTLNRKFDAQQDRLDRYDKRIQVLESRTSS